MGVVANFNDGIWLRIGFLWILGKNLLEKAWEEVHYTEKAETMSFF